MSPIDQPAANGTIHDRQRVQRLEVALPGDAHAALLIVHVGNGMHANVASLDRLPPRLDPHDFSAVVPVSQPPLLRKPPRIFIQQLADIDPIALKRAAAKMMDKQIMRHRQFKPRPPGPLGEIIIIKQPQPKPLIEPADFLINRPLS